MRKLLIALLAISFCTSALAESPRYEQYRKKPEEAFVSLINKNLNKLSNETVNSAEDLEILRDNLIFVLSRPNVDGAQAALLPQIEQIYTRSVYEEALLSITDEALFTIKQKTASDETQASYYFVLENILTEITSDIKTNENYKNILRKIHKSRIRPSRKVVSYRRLNGMYKTKPLKKKTKKLMKMSQIEI